MPDLPLRIEPFTVAVPDEVLTDLDDRLRRTRFPEQIPDAGWDYGTNLGYLRELVDYWLHSYDWRKHEARLNSFDQFVAEIDGERIHFLHVRSPEPDALPLIITHGWPGSVVEFLDLIGPLTRPRDHGADSGQAFHVVCPSIPGYAFSGPTHDRGWDPQRIARAFATLMAGLRYERYGAQGGDWGSMISTQLALVDAAHVAGLHLNMVIALPPDGEDFSTLTEAEMAGLAATSHYMEHESGYAKIQATKPQTVGYLLDDSPAGLAAWIVEKFRTWSDCDGDVERRFTKDTMLTNVMLYWVTATGHSAGRLYYEATRAGRFGPQGSRVEVPTAAAIFPKEIVRPPRRWAEHAYNITRWTEMPSGGHFAALEEPARLVDDVRSFFATVR
ncbi:MAG: alpha/beta fold hydrolase [Actinobacteria bacterium]|nr:alpha/beta fold hydrolase [Actinomycetota bacterium]